MYATKNSPLMWVVHLSVLLLVILWTLPTAGLLISSLRDKNQLATSGWWTSMTTSTQNVVFRAPGPDAQVEKDGKFVISGNALEDRGGIVSKWGTNSQAPEANEPGTTRRPQGRHDHDRPPRTVPSRSYLSDQDGRLAWPAHRLRDRVDPAALHARQLQRKC